MRPIPKYSGFVTERLTRVVDASYSDLLSNVKRISTIDPKRYSMLCPDMIQIIGSTDTAVLFRLAKKFQISEIKSVNGSGESIVLPKHSYDTHNSYSTRLTYKALKEESMEIWVPKSQLAYVYDAALFKEFQTKYPEATNKEVLKTSRSGHEILAAVIHETTRFYVAHFFTTKLPHDILTTPNDPKYKTTNFPS
jgi:hypothetical protein